MPRGGPMTRPSLRRTPMLERLETRQVLSGVSGLSSDKQYVLELINLVRTNPTAAADRLTANLGPDVQATLSTFGLSVVGPLVLTQDFGSRQGAVPQILGVSYDDSDHDGFYTPGEGNGGLTIDAVNLSTNVKYEAQTSDSGGYQMPVAPNADYQVTAILNGTVVQSHTIHVSHVNGKTDLV